MRKICSSRKNSCSSASSCRADCEVRAEGLLDDQSGEAAARAGLVGLHRGQASGDDPEQLRDRRQVVDTVALGGALGVDLGEDVGEVLECGVVGVVATHVVKARDVVLPAPRRSPRRRIEDAVAEGVVVVVARRGADQAEALGELTALGEGGERGEDLAPREVAGRAEDDQRERADMAVVAGRPREHLVLEGRLRRGGAHRCAPDACSAAAAGSTGAPSAAAFSPRRSISSSKDLAKELTPSTSS